MGHDGSGTHRVTWLDEPEEHDYGAAADYLSLLTDAEHVEALVAGLREAAIVHRKAKDILRASGLPLLGPDNEHVADDLHKIHDDRPLSPILLIRGDLIACRALTVADGYHRICAAWSVGENSDIPCRLFWTPPPSAG